MWLRFSLVLIAFIIFLAPVNAVSVDYQAEIFNCLKIGLDSKSESNYLGGNDYKALQNYLLTLQNNYDFKAYAQKRGWNIKIRTEDDWFSVAINKRNLMVERLPLYPINDNDRFTLASFEEQTNDSFLRLPLYIRKYYQERFLATQKLLKSNPKDIDNFDQPIQVNKLREELPQLFQDDYWLVSSSARQKVQIESLFCATYIVAGQYQIELKIKNNIPGILFVFKPETGKKFPEIVSPRVVLSEIPAQFRNNRKIYITPVSSDNNLYYIASKDNSAAQFELLWNAVKKTIVYLQVGSGFCYGNETMNFTNNILFQYQGKYYLLRSTDNRRYSEVVYFQKGTLQNICHADHTAPEI